MDSVRIALTRGHYALIDREDSWRVLMHSWCCRPDGYAHATIKKKQVLLHRFIMKAKDGEEVDHENLEKLDCRKENLRLTTHSLNLANTRLNNLNTSGYKGIHYDKRRKKWSAHIRKDQVRTYLGSFIIPEEAAKAYDKAAKNLFGKFARLNFPMEGTDGPQE